MGALLGLAGLATIAGCGGSPAWAETTSGYRNEVESRARSQLRAQVAAGAASATGTDGASMEPALEAEMLMERPAAAESAGGFGGLDLSFGGGGPPAPSPWDAPSPSAAVDPGSAARQQLTSEVQRATSPSDERPRYAQNMAQASDDPPTATDATSRQLLIYEAHLGLAVHHVVEVQDRVEAMARERGGFLFSRTDDSLVVRVPADAFDGFMDGLQELGDVVSRRIQVQDVTEEFHDVQQRIRTLEAMRARVEQLLSQANDVEDALAVQQHLERITVELEQLLGRLRFLSDRVAYSTITVHFAERSATSAPTFQLPFRWLHSLGLDTLLSL